MRTLGSDNVAVRGHKAMREAYQWLLTALKELHAVAVERIVSGPFVVARLPIEGLSEPFHSTQCGFTRFATGSSGEFGLPETSESVNSLPVPP